MNGTSGLFLVEQSTFQAVQEIVVRAGQDAMLRGEIVPGTAFNFTWPKYEWEGWSLEGACREACDFEASGYAGGYDASGNVARFGGLYVDQHYAALIADGGYPIPTHTTLLVNGSDQDSATLMDAFDVAARLDLNGPVYFLLDEDGREAFAERALREHTSVSTPEGLIAQLLRNLYDGGTPPF